MTGLPFETQTPYLDRIRVETGDGSSEEVLTGGAERAFVPFRPFVLRPHQYRSLSFTYRFRSCPFPPFDDTYARQDSSGRTTISAGTTSTWRDQKIVFEVSGIKRSTVLQQPSYIVLVNATGDCSQVPPFE